MVLKAVVPEILHKTDSGGVALNLKNVSELRVALLKMTEISEIFLVEEMITDCVAELILGVTTDLQFGLSLTLGAGGIITELLKDSVVLMMPLSINQVKESISKLRAHKLLNGWRGQPEADSEQLIETLKDIREQYVNAPMILSIVAPDDIVRDYEKAGYTILEDPARAVRAAAALIHFGTSFEKN